MTNNHFSEVFKAFVEHDLEKLQINPTRRKREIEKRSRIIGKKNKQIVIREADRGVLVILNKSDNLAELNRLVGDQEPYSKLKGNLTVKYKAKPKNLVKRAQDEGVLNKRETRYLVPDAPGFP